MVEKLDTMLVKCFHKGYKVALHVWIKYNSWKLCLVFFFFKGKQIINKVTLIPKFGKNFFSINESANFAHKLFFFGGGMCCHNIGYDFNDHVHKCHQLNQNLSQDAHHYGYITKLLKKTPKKKKKKKTRHNPSKLKNTKNILILKAIVQISRILPF